MSRMNCNHKCRILNSAFKKTGCTFLHSLFLFWDDYFRLFEIRCYFNIGLFSFTGDVAVASSSPVNTFTTDF